MKNTYEFECAARIVAKIGNSNINSLFSLSHFKKDYIALVKNNKLVTDVIPSYKSFYVMGPWDSNGYIVSELRRKHLKECGLYVDTYSFSVGEFQDRGLYSRFFRGSVDASPKRVVAAVKLKSENFEKEVEEILDGVVDDREYVVQNFLSIARGTIFKELLAFDSAEAGGVSYDAAIDIFLLKILNSTKKLVSQSEPVDTTRIDALIRLNSSVTASSKILCSRGYPQLDYKTLILYGNIYKDLFCKAPGARSKLSSIVYRCLFDS